MPSATMVNRACASRSDSRPAMGRALKMGRLGSRDATSRLMLGIMVAASMAVRTTSVMSLNGWNCRCSQ